MIYTQIKIKEEYRDKLKALATLNKRSMANMVEVLIDQELGKADPSIKVNNSDEPVVEPVYE